MRYKLHICFALLCMSEKSYSWPRITSAMKVASVVSCFRSSVIVEQESMTKNVTGRNFVERTSTAENAVGDDWTFVDLAPTAESTDKPEETKSTSLENTVGDDWTFVDLAPTAESSVGDDWNFAELASKAENADKPEDTKSMTKKAEFNPVHQIMGAVSDLTAKKISEACNVCKEAWKPPIDVANECGFVIVDELPKLSDFQEENIENITQQNRPESMSAHIKRFAKEISAKSQEVVKDTAKEVAISAAQTALKPLNKSIEKARPAAVYSERICNGLSYITHPAELILRSCIGVLSMIKCRSRRIEKMHARVVQLESTRINARNQIKNFVQGINMLTSA